MDIEHRVLAMIPDNHHDHDTKWIEEKLSEIPLSMHSHACVRYSEVYETEYQSSPEIKAEGNARRAANLRLMEFCDKVKNNKHEKVFTLKGVDIKLQGA